MQEEKMKRWEQDSRKPFSRKGFIEKEFRSISFRSLPLSEAMEA
jgi:hypothetical protein